MDRASLLQLCCSLLFLPARRAAVLGASRPLACRLLEMRLLGFRSSSCPSLPRAPPSSYPAGHRVEEGASQRETAPLPPHPLPLLRR